MNMIYPERDVMIFSAFVFLALILKKFKIIHYLMLYAAAILDIPYIELTISMSLATEWGFGFWYLVLMALFAGLAFAVTALFSFRAKNETAAYHYRLWHYFALGCIIFMGMPFALLVLGPLAIWASLF